MNTAVDNANFQQASPTNNSLQQLLPNYGATEYPQAQATADLASLSDYLDPALSGTQYGASAVPPASQAGNLLADSMSFVDAAAAAGPDIKTESTPSPVPAEQPAVTAQARGQTGRKAPKATGGKGRKRKPDQMGEDDDANDEDYSGGRRTGRTRSKR